MLKHLHLKTSGYKNKTKTHDILDAVNRKEHTHFQSNRLKGQLILSQFYYIIGFLLLAD